MSPVLFAFSHLVDMTMINSIVFGPSGPKPFILDFGYSKLFFNNTRKHRVICEKYHFGKYQNLGDRKFQKLWERRVPTNYGDPFYNFLKLLNRAPMGLQWGKWGT